MDTDDGWSIREGTEEGTAGISRTRVTPVLDLGETSTRVVVDDSNATLRGRALRTSNVARISDKRPHIHIFQVVIVGSCPEKSQCVAKRIIEFHYREVEGLKCILTVKRRW